MFYIILILFIHIGLKVFRLFRLFPTTHLKLNKMLVLSVFATGSRSIIMIEVSIQLHPEGQDFPTDISKHD